MVKVNLTYNPYLLNTDVEFNGQKPRINSLVEKYQKMPLQNWISRIPKIFYDEMNGYDFELDFSGTKSDFLELCEAFQKAGVGSEEVTLVHRNELDSRREKQKNLMTLLKWLDENRNRQFDYESFAENNEDTLDDSFPFIIFHGQYLNTSVLDGTNLEVEKVNTVHELTHTKLKNTPIVFCIERANLKMLPTEVHYFTSREDVSEKQLFFMIDMQLDSDRAIRTLRDLGIKVPQVVEQLDAPIIISYFERYPLTDYIYQTVQLLKSKVVELDAVLKKENFRSEIANKEVYIEIDILDDEIQELKNVLNDFQNRDNLTIPDEWKQKQRILLDTIQTWRARKTKISNSDEAAKAAMDFAGDTHEAFEFFFDSIEELKKGEMKTLVDGMNDLFETTGFSLSMDETVIEQNPVKFPVIRDLFTLLMNKKVESLLSQQNDIFNLFKKNDDKNSGFITETVYYYQDWRELVSGIVTPLSEQVIQEQFEQYSEYENRLADIYIQELERLVNQLQQEKQITSEKLSGEEQKLREDNDWLATFKDQLKGIERN